MVDDMYSRFDAIRCRVWRTDGLTDRQKYHINIARQNRRCDKNSANSANVTSKSSWWVWNIEHNMHNSTYGIMQLQLDNMLLYSTNSLHPGTDRVWCIFGHSFVSAVLTDMMANFLPVIGNHSAINPSTFNQAKNLQAVTKFQKSNYD